MDGTEPSVGVGESEREPGVDGVTHTSVDWTTERTADGDVAVGDRVEFTKRITDAEVRAFAAASGDTNRLHLDEEFAAGTRFGGRIVHGGLVAGLISAALARLPGTTVYLSQDLRFEGPAPVGGEYTAVVEVVEALDGGRYRLTTRVLDDGEAIVDGEAVVLIDDDPDED